MRCRRSPHAIDPASPQHWHTRAQRRRTEARAACAELTRPAALSIAAHTSVRAGTGRQPARCVPAPRVPPLPPLPPARARTASVDRARQPLTPGAAALTGAAPYTDVSGLVPLLAVAAAVVWERRTGGSTGIRAAAADALKKAKTAITSAASSVKDRLPKGDGSTGGGGDVKAAAADAPKQAKAAIASIFSNLKGLLPKGGASKGGGDAKSIAAAEAKRDRAAAEATEAAQVFLSKSDEVATSTAAMKIASDSEDEGEGEAKTASTSASSAKYTPKKNMWVVTSATATSSIPATRAGSNRAGQTASASASSATPQKKDMWKPVAFFAGLAALAGLSVAK